MFRLEKTFKIIYIYITYYNYFNFNNILRLNAFDNDLKKCLIFFMQK